MALTGQINVRMPQQDYETLFRLARDRGESISQVATYLLISAIHQEVRKQNRRRDKEAAFEEQRRQVRHTVIYGGQGPIPEGD